MSEIEAMSEHAQISAACCVSGDPAASCHAAAGSDRGAGQLGRRRRLQALRRWSWPTTIQLYYQIALTGQRDLPLAPDAQRFGMVMLRMLAFRMPRRLWNTKRAEVGGGAQRPRRPASGAPDARSAAHAAGTPRPRMSVCRPHPVRPPARSSRRVAAGSERLARFRAPARAQGHDGTARRQQRPRRLGWQGTVVT